MQLLQLEAFRIYAICACLLALNLFVLANYTAFVRWRSKQVINPEDATSLKAAVADAEHERVARTHRAHRNAVENILPFFIVGLLYAMSDPTPLGAKAYFITFTAARWLHSICYLAGLQPWRTVAYVVGLLATLGMMVHVVFVSP